MARSCSNSTHEAELDIPNLPLAARLVHIVPAPTTASLLSKWQLYDAGCQVTFDAVSVRVLLDNVVILRGDRTPATDVYHLSTVPLPASDHQTACVCPCLHVPASTLPHPTKPRRHPIRHALRTCRLFPRRCLCSLLHWLSTMDLGTGSWFSPTIPWPYQQNACEVFDKSET